MYRSGEVSKILGIHVESLRYFESIGIIKPKKNKSNNYRYFDNWDIYYMLDYKRYRSFDFSTEESKILCHDDNLSMFQDHFEEKFREIQKKALHYKVLEEVMEQNLDKIRGIHNYVGKIELRKSNETFCLIYGNDEWIQTNCGISEVYKSILDHYPFFNNIIQFRKESIISNLSEPYRLGFIITKEIADKINFPIDKNLILIPPQDCFYTVICAGDKGTLTHHLLDDLLKYIEEAGYQLNGDVNGNLIARINEDGKYHRYFEFWMPVCKKTIKNPLTP